jgi:tetratricopeptide (TPR) repeat protein
MTTAVRVFLSAATEDMGVHRREIAQVLRRKGCRVKVQEELNAGPDTLLGKLRECVEGCEAFVGIVGCACGSGPPAGSVPEELQRLLPGGISRASYTQWEYFIAESAGMPRYVFLAPGGPRPDLDPDGLQAKFIKYLRGTNKDSQRFSGIDDLKLEVALLKDLGTGTPASWMADPFPPSRLRHGAEHLFGRDKELADLDEVWSDPARHVLTIVAWGGVGKTSLVVEWMARKAAAGWPGFERVFDWSYYSQGTREQGAASADPFIAKALEFFGDPEMAQSAASPWDKGARLARLVAEQRTLLVLDGMEPLQYPPGPMAGKLKDPALEALLKGLVQRNPGLCIVTTRQRVADLAPYRDTTAPERELRHLSIPAGIELLKTLGVRGTETEFEQLVKDVAGHALTLNLFGCYLTWAHNGDIRKKDQVRLDEADDKIQSGHAFKTMAAYEQWLATGGDGGERARAVLRLLGLFDRPAEAGCLTALRRKPVIKGLTEPLVGLDEDDWNLTVVSLAGCRLASIQTERSAIDAHPLIREYFAKQLRENNPKAWRAAHRRLYDHLKESTKDKLRPTLEDLQPLYQAVSHGCQAGMHQEACDDVYHRRIRRGQEFYSTKKLAAFGADLGAVACFFEQPWSRLSPNLGEADQAWLLNQAAFSLRALGRLTEALEPMRAGLDMRVEQEDWTNAAINANNLSELELTLGQISDAVRDAEQSVVFADRSGDAFERLSVRSTLADALHQAGRRDRALPLFREAETMQAERQPQFRLLYSLGGFRYCDLLLGDCERAAWQGSARGAASLQRCREVARRAAQTLKLAERNNWLLAIALDHLTLGRAALYNAILSDSKTEHAEAPQTAREQLTAAVDGLRRSGNQDDIPRALLSRAWLRSVGGDADGARADLDEAWQIAERGPMRLFMADIYLYRARLFHDRESLSEARVLIEKCGYRRRKEELEDAEAAAWSW